MNKPTYEQLERMEEMRTDDCMKLYKEIDSLTAAVEARDALLERASLMLFDPKELFAMREEWVRDYASLSGKVSEK